MNGFNSQKNLQVALCKYFLCKGEVDVQMLKSSANMAIIYDMEEMEDDQDLSYEWEDEGEEEDWGEDLPEVYFWAVALSTVVGGLHIF